MTTITKAAFNIDKDRYIERAQQRKTWIDRKGEKEREGEGDRQTDGQTDTRKGWGGGWGRGGGEKRGSLTDRPRHTDADRDGRVVVVCWLLNVPATCKCVSGTDLLRQFYVLPH